MRFIILLIACWAPLLFITVVASEGELKGTVTAVDADTSYPLEGAYIRWENGETSAYSGADGKFVIEKLPESGRLIVTHVGFVNDTIIPQGSGDVQIILRSKTLDLLDFEILSERESSPSFHVASVERVSSDDLQRSSCCDLSGCFENTASVDSRSTDPSMGRREIALLGLEGVHTEVMLDGQPSMIWGLTRGHGMNAMPGALISDIFITKGPNSALQTSEGAGGMIDVRTREPGDSNRLHLNTYVNSHAENQYNAIFSCGENKWKATGAAHFSNQPIQRDINDDGYLDAPLFRRGMIFHKGHYLPDFAPLAVETGVRAVLENRETGHIDFFDNAAGADEPWGRKQDMHQLEVWKRTDYKFSEKDRLQYFVNSGIAGHSGQFSPQNSFTAGQHHLTNHLQYNRTWLGHDFRGGVSHRYRWLEAEVVQPDHSESFLPQHSSSLSGFFAENSFFLLNDNLAIMPGIRFDIHNTYGSYLTPRLLTRYDTGNWTFQAIAGKAVREPFPFAEYGHLFSSSRTVRFDNNLQMEKSRDFGIAVLHTIERNDRPLFSWSVEAHRSYFENQLSAVYDNAPDPSVHIASYDQSSINDHLQIQGTWYFTPSTFLMAAYVYHDNFAKVENSEEETTVRRDHALNQHKVLLSGSHTFPGDAWQLDANAHFYGGHIQPHLAGLPEDIVNDFGANDFAILNAQVTRNFANFSVYAGVENLTDYRVSYPILNVNRENTLTLFDPNLNSGPALGRTIYIGLNWYPF